MENTENKEIKMMLKYGYEFMFTGKYRRDLEKPNWHYYEDVDGTIYHFRKEYLMFIAESPIEE